MGKAKAVYLALIGAALGAAWALGWYGASVLMAVGCVLYSLREAGRLRGQVAELVGDLDAIVCDATWDGTCLKFTFVSPRAEDILGYPPEDWIGDPQFWSNHVHPEDREWVLKAGRDAMEKGGAHDLDYRMIAADGRTVWLRTKVRVRTGERGGVARVRGLMMDATDTKTAEQALQETDAELRRVLSSVSDCVWAMEMDADGAFRMVFVSPVVERLTGRPAEYFTNPSRYWQAVHEEDRERLQRELQRLVQGEMSATEIEYRVVWPDGSVRWLRSSAASKKLPDGRIRVDGADSDITAHREAEEALRKAKDALEAIIEASPLAIYVLDPEGIVKRWNPAAERIFGWTEAESVGNQLPIIGDGEAERFRLRLDKVAESGTMAGLEVKRQRKDGTSVMVSLWITVLRDASGAPLEFIGMAADVSERKQLEEQLRQSQKMEAVGRLAGGVAHDFNNLLTVITGYGYMLLEDMDPGSNLKANVEEILHSVERASALTNQLLAFSRRQIAQPKTLDLNALVLNMDKMLRRVIGEDIELLTKFHTELGKVNADPGHLEQVIMNLVVNSRDAMPQGGRITIETANVTLGREYARVRPGMRPGPYVLLSVTDTGVGMTDEVKAHIFEPFYTTKERGKGTGLGLSTVYGIVKQNNGDIAVTSEPGRGTRIRIYLPRIEAAEAAQAAPAEDRGRRKGTETVLVVEDESEVRTLVRDVLAQNGYQVLPAALPADALEISSGHGGRIDLLLTDMVMPQMNGPELAEKVMLQRPGIKVLFMSGYTDQFAAMGTRLLKKPFTPGALARRVRQELDGIREISDGRV